MDLGLRDSVALVSAASAGIGRAIAAEFTREGARVAMCSRDRDTIQGAAAGIAEAYGASPLPIVADVATAEGCAAFVREGLARFGRLDTLVVVTPPVTYATFEESDDADWREGFERMFFPAVRLTREALPELRKTKGSIVFLASTAVLQPGGFGDYVLAVGARSAVHGILKTLSKELGPDGVRVNAVLPSVVATERVLKADLDTARRKGLSLEDYRATYLKTIPLGRYGEPEELAAAVAFLASKRASFITGASLAVDGGEITAA